MVEAAEADVVGPAVAADDPDALAHERAGERLRAAAPRGSSSRASRSRSSCDERGAARRCRLGGAGRRAGEGRRQVGRELGRERAGLTLLRVEREPHAEPELGVVLEQGVRPGRPAAVAVRRPRRRRQVAAVDRGAAGRVGDDHPVAEQLGQQLQVRASRRSPRRRRRTRTAARSICEPLTVAGSIERAVDLRDREEEVEALALDLEVVALRLEVDRAVADRLLRVRRARVDADPAAGAVVGSDLDRHLHPGQVPVAPVLHGEARRGRRRAPPAGTPSSGSRRAGRRSRTWRSRCRSTDPRSGSPPRSSASRAAPCRPGRSRRRAAR